MQLDSISVARCSAPGWVPSSRLGARTLHVNVNVYIYIYIYIFLSLDISRYTARFYFGCALLSAGVLAIVSLRCENFICKCKCIYIHICVYIFLSLSICI